jgi:hypothetical protein
MFEPTLTEAQAALAKMRAANDSFYALARQSGCHAFIEFAGLQVEFIKLCEESTRAGDLSWMHTNVHRGGKLPLEPTHAHYLAEKLDCIFGPTLRSTPELLKAFLKT